MVDQPPDDDQPEWDKNRRATRSSGPPSDSAERRATPMASYSATCVRTIMSPSTSATHRSTSAIWRSTLDGTARRFGPTFTCHLEFQGLGTTRKTRDKVHHVERAAGRRPAAEAADRGAGRTESRDRRAAGGNGEVGVRLRTGTAPHRTSPRGGQLLALTRAQCLDRSEALWRDPRQPMAATHALTGGIRHPLAGARSLGRHRQPMGSDGSAHDAHPAGRHQRS